MIGEINREIERERLPRKPEIVFNKGEIMLLKAEIMLLEAEFM